MVYIKTLVPGDCVKIVDRWVDGCHANPDGEMDHWLGKIMTVREVWNDYVKMEEDIEEWNGGWSWFSPALDCIVENDDTTFPPPADLLSFLLRK